MTHLKNANHLFRHGDYESAIKIYESALKNKSPINNQVLFNLKLCKQKIDKKNTQESKILITLNEKKNNNQKNNNEPIEYYDKNHPAAPYLLSHQIYTIDIIIPVYNALDDVKKCLQSLTKNTDHYRARVIVVNDFSDQETSEWLFYFCKKNSLFTLIEHEINRGYTKSINSGLKISKADYIVTLNSDTIVTKGWLKSLIRCINSDKSIGIVGPLSNAASWQNVPHLLDQNKQFAINEIPLGLSPDEMAAIVNTASHRIYPRVPFVNGFCFMVKREVITTIGILDEESFPTGYGEENDYCIRAGDAGFELAIADDAYVFHAKSKSFGHEKRAILSKQGSETLKHKHGQKKYSALVETIKDTTQLDKVRSLINCKIKSYKKNTPPSLLIHQLKILFLLPVKGGGGGAHSVVQEVQAMRDIGINAKIAIKSLDEDRYYNNYSKIKNLDKIFIAYKNDEELKDISSQFSIVIATIFKSVASLKKITTRFPNIMPAYYIQDYEPNFFTLGSDDYNLAYKSYSLIPNIYAFAKTEWIIKKVEDNHGIKVEKVSPSIDHEIYKPGNNKQNKKIKISAMIRPQTPYRGAVRTMNILKHIKTKFNSKVEIEIFGCESENIFFENYIFDYKNHSILKREEVSILLASSDLFLDLSDYQAFGRTALEAMACGCATVVTKYGGVHEYSRHRENTILVDPFDEKNIIDEIDNLLNNPDKINKIINHGIVTASNYNSHKAAVSEAYKLINTYSKFKENIANFLPRIALIPSMRGDGKPAGSGYVRVVLPYTNNKITERFIVTTHSEKPVIDDHDIFLIQRDASFLDFDNLKKFVTEIKNKNKKIIYEIDDDLLNNEGMVQRGYKKDPYELAKKVIFLAQSADKITVSTSKLREIMSAYNDHVIVVPNSLDENVWRINNQKPPKEKDSEIQHKNTIKIGYIGTQTHQKDLDILVEAIKEVEVKYGSLVTVEIIGAYQNITPKFGNRVSLPKNTDYPSFVDWLLKRVNWDIGIIPLYRDDFNLSKSNLKFLEYAALNMAIIVSNISTYSDIAKHGENCLIAENTKSSWFQLIERLILSGEEREKLSQQSYKDLIKNFTFENSAKDVIINRVLTFKIL